jgi:hypothetical protein
MNKACYGITRVFLFFIAVGFVNVENRRVSKGHAYGWGRYPKKIFLYSVV